MRETGGLNNLRLRPDEIGIHLLRIGMGPLLGQENRLLTFLPQEERERLAGLEREEQRREFLWSRLLMRLVLSFYLDMEPDEFEFGYGTHGKPFLRSFPWVQFNLSHTDGLIAYSVGLRRMGVDVEKTGENTGKNWNLLAERFFSKREKKSLFSSGRKTQRRLFYQIFTRKEAGLKAEGSGLSRPLGHFPVPITLRQKSTCGGWTYFTKFLEPGGYCLTQAVERSRGLSRYRFFEWTCSAVNKFLTDRGPRGTHGHLHH